jgi:molybdopterin synthase sulfur carrier subunit
MKVRVKLFGVLGLRYPGYDMEKGMELEIPDGARVQDLLTHLRIVESREGVVAVNGLIMKAEDVLKEGSAVHILEPVFGG